MSSSSSSTTEQRVAFRSTAVVTGFEGKVECVTHYSSRVVLGSQDGRLVMYDTRKGTSTSTASYTFAHGKRVDQLLAVPHIRMLIAVSNGQVSAHGATDLKTLEFDFSKANAHHVRLVCVNQRGPPHFRLGVALLKRKAIAIYQYSSTDKKYSFLREFSTQDVPEAMSWYRNKVVVGFRKNYFLLNDKSGEATPVNAPGIQDPTVFPVVKLLPKEEILVTVMDRVGVFVSFTGDTVPKNSITWSQSPQQVEFSSLYLLALVPRVGVEIHRASDGVLVQTMPMARVVCMFANGMKWDMEPRPSGDSEDVVMVGVRDSNGTSSVMKVEPMPHDQQVGELLDRGQIDEAQNFVRKSIASLSSEKQRSKIKRFQRQATVALLRRLEFDNAVDYMYRAAIEPCEFIAFFPDLQCASFAYEPSVFKPEVLPRGSSSAPDITSVIQELLSSPRTPLDSDIAKSDVADLINAAQKALLKFLGQYKKHQRDKARARATPASSSRGRSTSAGAGGSPKDARRVEAIDTALFRLYVHFKRYKELLVLIQEPNPDVEGPPGSLGGCALELEACQALLVKHNLYYEAAQLLCAHQNYDKALEILALLHHGEYKQRSGSSGMPKSPIEAAIDVLVAVPESESAFIFKQSIWIIKATSAKQALRIFTDRRPPLPSNDVVAHLREYSGDPAVVQRYLETLVKATGETGASAAGATATVGDSGSGNVAGGSSRGFSAFVDPGGAELGVNDSYSHFLAGDNDDDDEPTREPGGGVASIAVDPHHTRLALEYLDETLRLVAKGEVPSKSQPGKESGALGDTRKRLLKFLKSSSSRYDVAPLVEKIRGKALYNEFVILCGRGALHEEAITSLVYELNDLRGAESYSVKYGARAPSAGSAALAKQKAGAVMERNEALMKLLKICFAPRDESKKAAFHDFGFQLLARHGKSLDSAAVLEMVPPSTPLSKLGEFFAQALPHSAHNVREMSIAKSLSNVYNLQVQCDRVERLTQSVQVDPNTLCPVCRKRIGDIVFAVYPNNKVVHYNCTNSNLQLCPVTGEHFT